MPPPPRQPRPSRPAVLTFCRYRKMRFWSGALRTRHGNGTSATSPAGPFGANQQPPPACPPPPPGPARSPSLPAAPRRGRPVPLAAAGRIRWAAPSPSAPSGPDRGTPWLPLPPAHTLPPPEVTEHGGSAQSTVGSRGSWPLYATGRTRVSTARRRGQPPGTPRPRDSPGSDSSPVPGLFKNTVNGQRMERAVRAAEAGLRLIP